MPRTPTYVRTSPLRAAALLALGALVLHELRYLIDPGAASTPWAGEHGYLAAGAPLLIVLALSLVVATLLGPLVGRRRSRARGEVDRTGGYALALLLVHLGQEAGEGVVAGIPMGALGVSLLAAAAFAIPLALALGGLTAALARWLERAERRFEAALNRRRIAPAASTPAAPAPLRIGSILELTTASGRGPPAAIAGA